MKDIILLDWGDGNTVEVKTPDLSSLPTVMCPPARFPAEGDPKMAIPVNKKVNVSRLPCSETIE